MFLVVITLVYKKIKSRKGVVFNMSNINVETWNNIYAQSRSLLTYPDETVVSFLTRNQEKLRGGKGIDIGCGAGRHTFLMNQFGIEALGIDSSEAAIKYANAKAKSLNLQNITFKNVLVQDLEIVESSYDIVIVWGVLHYLEEEDRNTLLDKIYKMLKNDGLLLCTLRSIEDTRARSGKKIGENRYLVNYFDVETNSPKQTAMSFWNEDEVKELLHNYKNVSIGHRSVEPIGKLGTKSSHWLVAATK